MPPPNSFHLFASLPPELRLKIYTEIELLSLTPTTAQIGAPTTPSESTLHILKISYSPALNRYISDTPPPLTLAISKESREQTLLTWTYLSLGPATSREPSKPKPQTIPSSTPTNASSPYQHLYSPSRSTTPSSSSALPKTPTPLHIPIAFSNTILYISNLSLLLSTLHFQHTFLFHLSTSQSRHAIQHLAIDLRVWNELCENGFLGVLGRMRGLRCLSLVVEFGRTFTGALGFLPSPPWRTDLHYLAKTASRDIERVRDGIVGLKKDRGVGGGLKKNVGTIGDSGKEPVGKVDVRCVLLTRGGEQA